jgi:DNA polymerase III alpha subunit (gram-positive type)
LPELSHHKLADLAKYYGISSDGAHRAFNDYRMNQQMFEYLGNELKKASAKGLKILMTLITRVQQLWFGN